MKISDFITKPIIRKDQSDELFNKMNDEELQWYLKARNTRETEEQHELLDTVSQSYYDMFKLNKSFLQLIILKK